jgi:ParB-like chromosome segregation protein Spo0J
MDADAFERLVRSIEEIGQLEPIVVFEGQVLDGRHRLRACEQLGIEPNTVLFEDLDVVSDDPLQELAVRYVCAQNLERRHLSASQKAMVAAELAQQLQAARQANRGCRTDLGQEPARPWALKSSQVAAKAVGVGSRSVERASVVVRQGVPAVVEAVRSGQLSVRLAATVARLPVEDQERLATRLEGTDPQRAIARAANEIKAERREARRSARAAEVRARVALLPESPDLQLVHGRVQDQVQIAGGARFGLIHADPSWDYDQSGVRGASEVHYEGMELAEIVGVLADSAQLARPDAYLLVWVTGPFAEPFLAAVAESDGWPWAYVGQGCWGKTGGPGSGFVWRGNAEFLMVFRRGKPPQPESAEVRNLWLEPRGAHSEKPEGWLRLLVDAWTDPRDSVLDLWAGRAPMARACAATGRSYLGIELDLNRLGEARLALEDACPS